MSISTGILSTVPKKSLIAATAEEYMNSVDYSIKLEMLFNLKVIGLQITVN